MRFVILIVFQRNNVDGGIIFSTTSLTVITLVLGNFHYSEVDQNIIKLLQRENVTGMESLYDHYCPVIFGMAFKMTMDEKLSEEILHKVLLEIKEIIHELPDLSLKNLAVKITRQLIKEHRVSIPVVVDACTFRDLESHLGRDDYVKAGECLVRLVYYDCISLNSISVFVSRREIELRRFIRCYFESISVTQR